MCTYFVVGGENWESARNSMEISTKDDSDTAKNQRKFLRNRRHCTFQKKIERKRLFCLWETCAVRELRPLFLPLLFWEACWQPKRERTILKGGKGREITLFRLREKKKRKSLFFPVGPETFFPEAPGGRSLLDEGKKRKNSARSLLGGKLRVS